MSVVIQRASSINLSGEFHTRSQGWSFSFDSLIYRWGVFPCAYPVTWSLGFPLKSLLLCAHSNEPLITPHRAKTLFCVILLHYQAPVNSLKIIFNTDILHHKHWRRQNTIKITKHKNCSRCKLQSFGFISISNHMFKSLESFSTDFNNWQIRLKAKDALQGEIA